MDHHSMSTLSGRQAKPEPSFNELQMSAKNMALEKAGKEFLNVISEHEQDYFYKSDRKGGAINPEVKGVIEPDATILRWGYDARGLRQKYFNLSFDILRELSNRVIPVGAIQNLRCMQIQPFTSVSYNDNDIGFRVKLKKKDAAPDKKDKIIMAEIEDFFLHCGYTNFPGAKDREEGLPDVVEELTREVMTIDQIALSLRKNRKGKLLDFWVLDGATIKRILKGREESFGSKDARFVQEIDGRIMEVFNSDELLFTYMNRRTDIRKKGYGYSFLEMSIDILTAWLFGMAYNKEVFNSSSQPKGLLSFEGEKMGQEDLEELQRQWISMFRGIKGMWKTPFLQYGAKWTPIAPSNRDMEFNEYIQMLSSWICAIHGVDSAEFGIRLNQAQNVLNDNQEAKIAYSKDRGLKHILSFHSSWINKIIDRVEEWSPYYLGFTGMEAKSQAAVLDVDEKQTKVYMTLNEKRKEKDLPPLEDGDIILDPTFVQYKQAKMPVPGMPGAEGEGGGEGGEAPEEDIGDSSNALWTLNEDDAEESGEGEEIAKSFFFKAMGHKYIKRTGSPGNYQYWYRNPQTGKLEAGKEPSEDATSRIDARSELKQWNKGHPEKQKTEEESETEEEGYIGLEKKSDGFFYHKGIKLSSDREKAKKYVEAKAKGERLTPKTFPPEMGQKIRIMASGAGRKTEAHKARGVIGFIREIKDGMAKIVGEKGQTWTVNQMALEMAKSFQNIHEYTLLKSFVEEETRERMKNGFIEIEL